MLVFSAIVPHSPILLPTIGKNYQSKLKKTLGAIKTLEEDLYVSKPETLIFFSPHGNRSPDTFSINLATHYETNFQEFGDFATKIKFASDSFLVERLQYSLRHNNIPLLLTTEQFLDYGTAVPAFLLTQHLPQIALIPIHDSDLSLIRHYEFGQGMQEDLFNTHKRIALIASADLSHCLTDKAPGGFSPEGKKFDETLVQAIKNYDLKSLFDLESKALTAKACGLKTIAMMLGALEKINCSPELLSYEGPFGIGYLVAKFKLP
jgi:aromatic ring-opening dioxygenase LigB subunit